MFLWNVEDGRKFDCCGSADVLLRYVVVLSFVVAGDKNKNAPLKYT